MLHVWIAMLLLGAASSLLAQPAIDENGILNGASYLHPDLPNGSIAQGSIFVIKGRGLGPASLVQANSYPLPTAAGLGGTRVRVIVPAQTGGVQTTDCVMIYASATQVAAILPSAVNTGAGSIEVVVNDTPSPRRPIRVVANSFGAFSLNEGGSGPAVVQNFNSESDQPVNTILNPARPGQTVILWGTGLGRVGFDETLAPRPEDQTNLGLELLVGGRPATLRYRGRSGCCSGVDQIVFDVPAGVEGCFVPMQIRIGNSISNSTTMAIAPAGRRCSSSIGFTEQDLDRIAGGSFRYGAVDLNRLQVSASVFGINLETTTDIGTARFSQFDGNQLIRSTGGQIPLSPGGCLTFPATQNQFLFNDPIRGQVLNAGAGVSVTSPGGAVRTMTPQADGSYLGTFSTSTQSFLAPGNYPVTNGSGAPTGVGSFNFTLAVPTPPQWTNRGQVNTINRPDGVEITWSGAEATPFVNIFGFSPTAPRDTAVGTAFICLERSSAGRFTVPPAVLLSLPPSPPGASLPNIPGFLGVGATTAPVRFSATGLDVGVATSSAVGGKIVTFQ